MDTPQRIVSLVPSHTESLHALGLAERVVGRTRFCIHPADWVETVPHVGGTKDADLQKILDLEPDLVVVDKDENPLALVQALKEAGIDVLHSDIDTVLDAADFLRTLGARCGVQEAADTVADDIEDAWNSLGGEREIPVFCPIWYDPWMTFNRSAYPHAMLEAVGLRNVFGNRSGDKYFEVSPDEVAESAAQWTLLPTEPFPFHKRRDAVDTSPLGPAGMEARVIEIDGEALTWFGVRTLPGLKALVAVRAQLEA